MKPWLDNHVVLGLDEPIPCKDIEFVDEDLFFVADYCNEVIRDLIKNIPPDVEQSIADYM